MPKATNNPLTKRSGGFSTNIVLTVGVLVVAVAVVGGLLLFGGNNDKGVASPALLRPPDSNTLTEAPNSDVTVVEFLDYQCPACAAYYQNVTKQVEQDYEGRITFVTRNFPLDMHPLAVPAARAAEAAALQGKYNQMYHALFDDYESWALTPNSQDMSEDLPRARAQFDRFARQIGLDMDRFHQDMDSAQITQRIERDRAAGEQAGVSGTPTIFINGTKFEPAGDSFAQVSQQLRDALDRALAR